jgi:hypothetical protein
MNVVAKVNVFGDEARGTGQSGGYDDHHPSFIRWSKRL